MRNRFMTICTALALLLGLVACGNDDNANDANGVAEISVGDTAQLDGATVTIVELELPVEDPNYGAEAGERIMGFDVEMCADQDGVDSTGFQFSARMPDNTLAQVNLGEKDPQYINSTLAEGECNRGWVTFTVPEDEAPAIIIFDDHELGDARWAVPE